jgi:hypothetical protein
MLDSEVDFGEAESPQPSALNEQVLYQGTASAVPNGHIGWALAPAMANPARESFSTF